MTNCIRFQLNGREIEESELSPTTTLLQYLRTQQHLTGTKEGCAEGDCGACTVVLIDHHADSKPVYRAINSCLLLLPMLQGKEVFTVEALAQGDSLHPVQQAMVEQLGSQCGYCTPGIVMSLFEAHYRKDLDAEWKLDDQMCGNLCRCTGYKPIAVAAEQTAGKASSDRFVEKLNQSSGASMDLQYQTQKQNYENPSTFGALWSALDENLQARIVCGGTDLSLEVTKQFKEIASLVSIEGIEELHEIQKQDTFWKIGAAVSLSTLEKESEGTFSSLVRMLRFFGARQIKNRGTLGGNLCNASPIGDMAPVLLSLGARLVLLSKRGEREIPIERFFLDYRKTALEKGEILAYILLPVHEASHKTKISAYKVSKRQELDISAISMGGFVALDNNNRVKKVRLGFGGVAAIPKRAYQTELALVGQEWTEESIQGVLPMLRQDFNPMSDHRGSEWYRRKVAENFLIGFYHETLQTSQPSLPYRPVGTFVLEEGGIS